MKENFTVLQVPHIDDKVMWEHLKEYEVEKHEYPESHENQPSDLQYLRRLESFSLQQGDI